MMKKRHQCPVCYMDVEIAKISTSFHGMDFYFCSPQCHERFTTNPHVYIGKRGIPAPKQRGDKVIKRRAVKLNSIVPASVADNIISELYSMMGIKNVSIDGKMIYITYDLLEVTAKQIEYLLEKTGNQVSTEFGASLKRAFIHYAEETLLDNLEHDLDSHSHN